MAKGFAAPQLLKAGPREIKRAARNWRSAAGLHVAALATYAPQRGRGAVNDPPH
jgi:hypothetical protein